MGNWLIIGSTSGIAQHLVQEFVKLGYRLYLADRTATVEECQKQANDLKIRYGVEVSFGAFEALDFDSHLKFIEEVETSFGALDGVVWVAGVMYKQSDLESNPQLARQQHDVNYTAAMSVLTIIANRMESRRSGTIVGFSSPAGDRIRKSNYFYGCDKMALAGFLDGLRMRLHDTGVHVVTVKPGPTATPMTADLESKRPLADPKKVAHIIAQGIFHNQTIIYAPGLWRYVMFVFRMMPRSILQKLNV